MGMTLWTYAVASDDSLHRLTSKVEQRIQSGEEVPIALHRDPGGVLLLEFVVTLEHRFPVQFDRPVISACAVTAEADNAPVSPLSNTFADHVEAELRKRVQRSKVQPMAQPWNHAIAELRRSLAAGAFRDVRYQNPGWRQAEAADAAARSLGLHQPKLSVQTGSVSDDMATQQPASLQEASGSQADELLMKLVGMQLPMAPDRPMTDLEGMAEVFGPNWEDEIEADIAAEEAEEALKAERERDPER
jgi:hypothetical protein